jgi:hypothetical protein
VTAAELVARLPGARRTPKGWEARCPAHDDKTASLSVGEGADGRVLLKCFAGCTFNAIVSALGVRPADLFPPKPEHAGRTRGRIVATYDYTDAAGKLRFQVVRCTPKTFRQRRPDPEEPDGWRWDMAGVERVLYRLPDVLKAKAEGRAVFCVEGEKDADALAALGVCATCNPGGAGKWADGYTATLTGARVVILPDKDPAGRRHAALVLRVLTGKARSVRVVELPNRDGHAVKDAADWIGAGGTVEELRAIVRTAPAWTPPPDDTPATLPATPAAGVEGTAGKPRVLLPRGGQSITDAGRALGELLAKTERFFVRGGAVVKLAQDPDGLPHLEDVRAAALASDFEAVAVLCKADSDGDVTAATCSEQTAKLIAASAAFRDNMRPIHVLTRCPVLIERAGRLLQVSGYDRESGILAAGAPAEAIGLAEARRLLCGLLDGFRFATPPDRARALAALVTPALVFGGLLRGRAPVDLGEADASQTGKGYRNKLTAAVYAQSVKTVTQQKSGGVGSMEEAFDTALLRGANFLALDNIRGRIDSPKIESFLTEDVYHARGPYREGAEIDPRRVCIMLTSNKADVTPDLANRCACVRLLKQPDGHIFATYAEGDILNRVRARQPLYLGAVFAIVRAWHDGGKPRTAETRHDFRAWAQTLDWMTRNLLDAGPLLDGHRETQARMTNPVLGWLREVALAVLHAGHAGAWLRATDLVDVIVEAGTETPGLPEHGDMTDPDTRKLAQQATGRKLWLCFRVGDVLTLDGMRIERRETWEKTDRYHVREYRVTAAADDGGGAPAIAAEAPTRPPAGVENEPELDLCGYGRGYVAADDAANETPIAANAADASLIGKHSALAPGAPGMNVATMEGNSRIAATPAPAVEYEEGEL